MTKKPCFVSRVSCFVKNLNGVNCRCSVRALTEREVRARWLTVLVGSNAPGGFTPDERWDHNPGETAWPVR